MVVWIYRNLNKRVWSIMVKGRVIGHAHCVQLEGCRFHVRPGGLARCRKEGVKNVHAFAIGELLNQEPAPLPTGRDWHRVRYDPFTCDTFVLEGSGSAVHEADAVYFGVDGSCLCRIARW
jgi:hypothetical protein